MPQTATEAAMRIDRIDLRKRRADSVASALFKALDRFIANECQREAFYEIQQVLFDEGVEILTDYDRQQLGLPARGPDGWTVEEIMAIEKRRLDLLNRPIAHMILTPKE